MCHVVQSDYFLVSRLYGLENSLLSQSCNSFRAGWFDYNSKPSSEVQIFNIVIYWPWFKDLIVATTRFLIRSDDRFNSLNVTTGLNYSVMDSSLINVIKFPHKYGCPYKIILCKRNLLRSFIYKIVVLKTI